MTHYQQQQQQQQQTFSTAKIRRGSSSTMSLSFVMAIALAIASCDGFVLFGPTNIPTTTTTATTPTRLQATLPDKGTAHSSPDNTNNKLRGDDGDDEAERLLRTVKKQQLVELCQQMNLATTGTKNDLLTRLRQHAAVQRQAHEERRQERIRKVEEGSDDPKERYELVAGEPSTDDDDEDETEEDDDDFLFYYARNAFPTNTSQTTVANAGAEQTVAAKPKRSSYLSRASVTAPQPPDHVTPNAQGERVVQVYSTTDQNDLTGIAASQPGLTATATDALTNAPPAMHGSAQPQPQPWDTAAHSQQRATSQRETQAARAEIIELVQNLLSMTGLPAFYFDDNDDDDENQLPSHLRPLQPPPTHGTIGFDPAKVPATLLPSFSQALRTGRGSVLQDVLREFELQAIGQDGLHGDKVENGGGHYREVAKVRAFLEGYRRAEVRRIARETTTLLLDKLVQEGVEGLDLTLATMIRSNDDTSEYGGELNDSLLDYLNDAIRQQEKKVDKLVAARLEAADVTAQSDGATNNNDAATSTSAPEDALDKLWNVTTTDEGGRLESLDPNDPVVKQVLEDELAKEEILSHVVQQEDPQRRLPETAPEKLLLLLSLLRDRIQAEATFVPDEKGRNLRLLAYCLQLPSDMERKQLLFKELGTSIDRFDSFVELVASSVEYGESTSHQLQPAKTKRPLNVRELRRILALAQDFRDEQHSRAAGFQ